MSSELAIPEEETRAELALPAQPVNRPSIWNIVGSDGEIVKMYRLGDETYPMKVAKRCKACTSEYRIDMEIAILQGYSYATIIRSLPEGEDVSAHSLGRHVKNAHMPLQELAKRMVIERAAQELGQDIEIHEGILGNQVTFARLGLQRVVEAMAKGELRPSIKDGIAFAKFLQGVESQAGPDVGLSSMNEILSVYYDAVEATVDIDQLAEIGRRIEGDPRLPAIKAKIEEALARSV